METCIIIIEKMKYMLYKHKIMMIQASDVFTVSMSNADISKK